MDYIDYLLVKLGALALFALVYGIYCGWTNQPLAPEQRDTSTVTKAR